MNAKQIAAIACVGIIVIAGVTFVFTNNSDDTVRSPWSPSGIIGSIPEEAPALEDDFFLNINYDIIKGSVTTDEDSALTTTEMNAMMQMDTVFFGTPISYEQELLQGISNAYSDLELRGAMGMDELMPLVDDLMSAKDLDDLTAYLTSGDYMISNPFFSITMGLDMKDNAAWATYLSPSGLTLSNPATYSTPELESLMEKKTEAYNKLLMLIGYSEDEARHMNELATGIEIEIARCCITVEEKMDMVELLTMSYNPRTINELREASPTFPIVDIIVSQGFEDDKYILEEPEWLDAMNHLYTEENFEGLRTILLRNHIVVASQFMEEEFFNAYLEFAEMTKGMAKTMLILGKGPSVYNWLINEAYMDLYGPDEETIDTIESMYDDLRESFANRLSNITWLSDETRTNALEKLDAMSICVGGPESPDYSNFILPSSTGTGGPLSDYIAADEFIKDIERSKIDTSDYRSHMYAIRSFTSNAAYVYNCNSVLVTTAFLQGAFSEGLDSDSPMEDRLAGLGLILAHEISHGFDPIGMKFDKDSNFNDWWTESEREVLESKMGVYADYFSTFEVVPTGTYHNGDLVLSEAVADLGAMAIVLDVANTVDGFDYERFFRTWCELSYQVMTPEYAENVAKKDIHPYNCYRVNATIQQFQEFYDTFGIEEGDGMYLSPEDRYEVW